ncbi:PREDICTED: ribosomal L1 domain-containing protein CG13096-like [Dinoponera quadriceps]|uniref:Ribosomal L1 domain-containing protein CG13096-like n=1 Tax=Dinoponera quadriceps TaxID=609295 RepID=A0A6P3X7H6_DINQU|nr:PREDICTED: ribosomal L1 domain-containing protein CG13096-like [Dinoponera quadriceps]
MILSQKKLSQNKVKRKLEKNVTDEDGKIMDKVLKMKKPKISGEHVEHVSETKQQEKSVSVKRKNDKRKTQGTIIKVVNKSAKKRKTLMLKVNEKMSRTPDEENDKAEDYLKEISKSHIQQCISAMFHLTEEQLNKSNLLTKEAQPIFLQVTCIRIPQVPYRQMRILLPYSIVTSDDEVALFVCDLEKGRKKDYEQTVEYYTNILTKHGCTRINEIIPINRVKTEFDQFELKRRLTASYDYFLVDSRIAGHMSHLLGKEFSAKRKLPTSVRMNSKDLKHEIDYALRKTSMQLHSYGDTHVVQVGHTLMKENQILENILAICKNLCKNYPGGWANIRSLRLKGMATLGLPLYMTLKDKNTVDPPVVNPKRPNAYRDVKGELSTFVRDTDVTVKPDGDVIVERITHEMKKKPRAN